jgi:hypothetical protein
MAGFQDRILVVISAAAGGAITEIDKLGKSTQTADTHANNLAKTMKGALVAGAAAFIGTGLVSFLSDSVSAYADAAKAAGDLAEATGGSVENVSRMTAALQDAGIDAETAASMLTKFTTGATGKNKDLLAELNVVLKEGKGGATDYADGMVQAVDAIMEIGDASKRNQDLVALFGKAGAQAFQDMIAAGVPLEEAMRRISEQRVFDDEDVRKAQEYDQAMDDLSAGMEGVQNSIGRTLVPIISDVVGAFTGMIDLMAEVPGEVYLVIGAAVLLNAAFKSQLIAGALSAVGTFVASSMTSFAILRADMGLTAAATATMSKAISAALLANPVTAILVALTVAFTAFRFAQKGIEDGAAKAAASLEDLEGQGLSSAEAVKRLAAEMESSRHAGLDFFAAFQAQGGWKYAGPIGLAAGAIKSMGDALRTGGADAEEYARQIEKIAEEQGAMAAKSADAEAKMKTLNDLIAEGTASNEELAAKVAESAEAQRDKNLVDETASGLMEAYASATWDAVEATISMFDAQHQLESAQRTLNEAVETYNKTLSDPEASEGDKAEAMQGVIDQAWALAAASTAAWAAEEQRYGRYPTQEQLDSHRLGALKAAIDALPASAGAAAEKLYSEYSRTLAAAATANPTSIPVGVTIETVDQAIANLQADLEAETNPQKKVDLQTDITALQTLKTNIETGAAAEVPATVVADPASLEGTKSDIENVAGDTTATVTVKSEYEGGYDGQKLRKQYLSENKESLITVTSAYTEGYEGQKLRKQYLSENKTSIINVVSTYEGGYDGQKLRKQYLSEDRTATITVKVVGAESARSTIAGLNAQANQQAAVQMQAWSQFVKAQQPQVIEVPQPVNIVKVNVDGQQLRATIRDELLRVRESDDLVAAMGTVA